MGKKINLFNKNHHGSTAALELPDIKDLSTNFLKYSQGNWIFKKKKKNSISIYGKKDDQIPSLLPMDLQVHGLCGHDLNPTSITIDYPQVCV